MSPDDATAPYRAAVRLLDPSGDGLAREGVLEEARELLRTAVRERPDHAAGHALLGHVHDLLGEDREALACLREARRSAPGDRTVDGYVLTLLAEGDDEAAALAAVEEAAPRHDLDLEALRAELRAVGFPTDARTLVLNGFPGARSAFGSRLLDEAEGLRDADDPGAAARRRREETAECEERSEVLRRDFRADRLPPALGPLADWAPRLGVGDDPCRAELLAALSPAERSRLTREVDAVAGAAHAWLDGFGAGEMPLEAEAVLYLLSGVEQIREYGADGEGGAGP